MKRSQDNRIRDDHPEGLSALRESMRRHPDLAVRVIVPS